jgi:hypothetical protein
MKRGFLDLLDPSNDTTLLLYSERQKYGINSLKIKQNFFQKNLWTGRFKFIKIHILIPNSSES